MPSWALKFLQFFKKFGTPCRSYESLSKLGALTVHYIIYIKKHKWQLSPGLWIRIVLMRIRIQFKILMRIRIQIRRGGGGRSAKNVHPPWQNPRYALGGGHYIHNLGAQWKYKPSYCDFLRGFFFILFAARISEAAMGRAEVRGPNMINTRLSRVQRSIEGCDRWGEGRGILYFEASVV